MLSSICHRGDEPVVITRSVGARFATLVRAAAHTNDVNEVVEVADRNDLFDTPTHPYTEALLSAIPIPDPRRRRQRVLLSGDPPSPIAPPAGCRFHTRCPIAQLDRCAFEVPELRPVGDRPGHVAACLLRT